MEMIVEIDPLLPEDCIAYRTLDFFSAAAIVNNHQLMFSRADTFSDKNEGIDRLLAQLEASMPKSGCGMGWHNDETARLTHAQVKRSYYISCWSTNSESVAMWSLYSPDHCSVRISTTISKLRVTVENFLAKYIIARLSENDLEHRVAVSVEGRIAPVNYASLSDISQRVARRAKARSRLTDRYTRKGQSMPAFNDIDPRYWQREKQRKFRELQTKCNLKDLSFLHEAEIRLAVRLGEGKLSREFLDLCDPAHPGHEELKYVLPAWDYISTLLLPEREFVSCPVDLIETVAIDPRCPDHKANFIRAWFREKGIKIVDSSCFGYIPDSFDVYPEW